MNRKLFLPACLISLIALLISYQVASAHETITVGDYTLVVGWLNEPPLVGQPNAIVVEVSTTSDEQPVEDVSSLTMTISYLRRRPVYPIQCRYSGAVLSAELVR